MIILLAGDVESNPGPTTIAQNDTVFPCAVCVGNVSWSEDTLQCGGCELWLHRSCMDMSTTEYNRPGQESSIWLCCNCGLRNMASSLFKSRHQTTHDSLAFSLGSISSPGEPLHMSSPEKVPRPKSVKGKPSLNIVNVNCQTVAPLQRTTDSKICLTTWEWPRWLKTQPVRETPWTWSAPIFLARLTR